MAESLKQRIDWLRRSDAYCDELVTELEAKLEQAREALLTFHEAMRNGSIGPDADKLKALTSAHRKTIKALAATDITKGTETEYGTEHEVHIHTINNVKSDFHKLAEALRLLSWAANDFDKYKVSNDNWRGDYQAFLQYDIEEQEPKR